MTPLVVNHRHWPLYRVVRASWAEPLDASYSQVYANRRWNTADFPALYCCCSVRVARAVVRDLMGQGALTVDDLQPSHRPQLVEIRWHGRVVDVASAGGVEAADLPADYPAEVSKAQTRQRARDWLRSDETIEGVVCRSKSLHRLGFDAWVEDHEDWAELAIFVQTSDVQPSLLNTRDHLSWLEP